MSILCGALFFLGSGAAEAQGHQPEDLSDEAAATLYNEGVKAAKAGQKEKARELFSEAWKRLKDYQIAANLGAVEYALGMYRDAAEHLSYFLHEVPEDSSPNQVRRAQDMLKAASERIGAVNVHLRVPGAEVLVDGKLAGRAPLTIPLYVEPGKHTLNARIQGYTPVSKSFDIRAGAEITVELEPTKIPATQPGASTSPLSTSPVSTSVVPMGSVPATAPGPAPMPRPTPGTPQEGAPAQPRTALLIAGLGLGAVATAAGIGLLAAANGHAKDMAAVPSDYHLTANACMDDTLCARSHNDAASSVSLYSSLSVWAFLTAGAGFGAGILAYKFIKPKHDTAANISVRISLQGTGFTVTSSW